MGVIKIIIVVMYTLASVSNAFADTCEISIRDLFVTANIYSKQDASSVYAIIHNAAGRYEASFELYNISGCRKVSSGTRRSLPAVEDKMKNGGFEKVFSIDSGKYFDLNGKQTFAYTMSLNDDEIIVDQHSLDDVEQRLIQSAQEDSDVIWVDRAYTKRQSEIFKAPEFWKRMSDESHVREYRKYYIHRWTLNKEDVSDLEDFLKYKDISDWKEVVLQLMKLRHGTQPETVALHKYMDDYPRGAYVAKAFEQASKNAYVAAKQKDTVEAYETYWAKYASSGYAKRVRPRFNKALFLAKKHTAMGSASIVYVEKVYKNHSDDKDIRSKLVSLYRQSNQFEYLIKAYSITKSKRDIKGAYLIASTVDERRIVEEKIVGSMSPEKIINIEVVGGSEGQLRDSTGSALVVSYKGSVQDYYRKIRISFNKQAGIQVKYGRYKVIMDIKLNLIYSNPINGKNKDFASKRVTVILSPQNNYDSLESITFENIMVNGEYHLLAATMLSGLANLFGMNVNSSDMDIPIELKNTELISNIVSVKEY